MPRDVRLTGQHIEIQHAARTNPTTGESEDFWTLVLTDTATQERIRVSFDRQVRDDIVRMLTKGIVLAGGELPRIRPT